MADLLKYHLAAGYPAIAVETFEEERFIIDMVRGFGPGSQSATKYDFFIIAAIGGLRQMTLKDNGALSYKVVDAGMTFSGALASMKEKKQSILIMLDWHHVGRNAPMYRALKDSMTVNKAKGNAVVVVAPSWAMPLELQHDVPVLSYKLPTRMELGSALDVIIRDSDIAELTSSLREGALDAAAGLTLSEAENSFALSFSTDGSIDPRIIEKEKMGLIRQSGYLEVTPPSDPALVGGLTAFREWLEAEVVPSWHDQLLRTKGALLVGIPGTGKSLASKMVGAILGCPVLRCDIGALKRSHVGESEASMRAALALADAVAPCVLWLDEIEKGVGGFASSAQTDSGVTLGMVGALLTWMQEHESQVIVLATCNDYAKLPAELTRAGRFDERFFVDLPNEHERAEISAIHLKRFCDVTTSEDSLLELVQAAAEMTSKWTGAEIEQLVKSAARRQKRLITVDGLKTSAQDIKPIAQVRAGEVAALQTWAGQNLRAANAGDSMVADLEQVRRRLRHAQTERHGPLPGMGGMFN